MSHTRSCAVVVVLEGGRRRTPLGSQRTNRLKSNLVVKEDCPLGPMFGVFLQRPRHAKERGRMHRPPRFSGPLGHQTVGGNSTPVHLLWDGKGTTYSLSSRSRAVSSVGSEHLVYTEGRGFESLTAHLQIPLLHAGFFVLSPPESGVVARTPATHPGALSRASPRQVRW